MKYIKNILINVGGFMICSSVVLIIVHNIFDFFKDNHSLVNTSSNILFFGGMAICLISLGFEGSPNSEEKKNE